MKDQIESLTSNDQAQDKTLNTLAHRGTWCAYKEGKTNAVGTVRYDRLTFEDYNMFDNGYGSLDINTGKGSFQKQRFFSCEKQQLQNL